MRKSLVAASALAVMSALSVAASARAADPGTYDTDVDGYGTIAVDVDGNAIAVAGEAGYDVSFRYRHVNGGWSQQYQLPDLISLGVATPAAAGRSGYAVVVGRIGMARLGVTIRRSDATWTTPYVLNSGLPGSLAGVDVTANADGDFAVSWTQVQNGVGSTYVAVRQRGGTWQRFGVGPTSVGPTQVGIDSYGNVTIARTVRSTATGPARLVVRRKPASGLMEAASQASRAGDDVDAFDQVIERTGRRTYAYQVAHASNDPFAASRVRRQQSVGGSLVEVWSNAASMLPSIAADGGRLRVVWIERPNAGDPAVVKTRAYNPAAGAEVEISDAPDEPAITGVTIDRLGVGVVTAGKRFGSYDEHVPTIRAYPVTSATVGGGDWIDEENPHWDSRMLTAKPVLGAGKRYFIAVNSSFSLPVGSIGTLLVFRGLLP